MENILKLLNGCLVVEKVDLGEGYIKHKQDELYKIPSDLITEIFVSLFDGRGVISNQHQASVEP